MSFEVSNVHPVCLNLLALAQVQAVEGHPGL